MKKYFIILIIFCLATLPLVGSATQDFYPFPSSQQQERFQTLTSELRCLVCQNQTLAESNAALANDLRTQIYQQMQQGQSDKQIIDYLVSRYGDFILYRPPLNSHTLGLWFGPLLILIMGMAYLFYYINKNKRKK